MLFHELNFYLLFEGIQITARFITLTILFGFAATFPSQTWASTVIFDDFSSGPVSLGSNGAARDVDSITTPFADGRVTFGSGLPNWTSTIDIQNEKLFYFLDIPLNDPEINQRFAFNYSSSLGNLDLVGYDAFVFHVEALTGTGEIMAFASVSPASGVIPVSLNTTGDLVIPFSYMNAENPSSPRLIGFWIIPDNPDFSVTISGISVVPVPEPSTFALLALGASVLFLVRQRL